MKHIIGAMLKTLKNCLWFQMRRENIKDKDLLTTIFRSGGWFIMSVDILGVHYLHTKVKDFWLLLKATSSIVLQSLA